MDSPSKNLDYPNISARIAALGDKMAGGSARTIPTYALYGEPRRAAMPERLHVEAIVERSALHDWEIAPHRHAAFFQIMYVREGRGQALLEEAAVELVGPAILTIPPLSVHGFRFEPQIDGVVIMVVDDLLDAILDTAPELAARLRLPRHLPLAGHAEAAAIDAGIRLLFAEYAGAGAGRIVAAQAALTLVLVRLARLLDVQAAAAAAGDPARRHAQRFLALVEESFRQRRSIPDYARAIGITPTHLNRVCRSVLGRSAQAVVTDRLLREIERDLVFTPMKVAEIAAALGFDDPAYFSRLFRRQTGMCPTAFRADARRRLARRGAD